MRPFLHLSVRPEDDAAEAEHQAVAEFLGLDAARLLWFRVEKAPLPPLDLARFSGVVVGGGPFNVSDAEKSDVQRRVEDDLRHVLDAALDDDLPFLGLCYGVGLLTAQGGGVVGKEYGEPVGAVEISLTDAGAADPLFEGLPRTFKAFTGHKEACTTLPQDAVLLATGERCPVQAYRMGRAAYVTQFHPELDHPRLAQRMRIYADAGYFAPEELEDLIEQAAQAQVGPEASRILCRFVELFGR